MVVKVLGSPKHMRKSVTPLPASLPSTRRDLETQAFTEPGGSGAKPEVMPRLKLNPNFAQGGTSIEQRAPRTRIKQEAKLSKRGSVGPGSRSQSRDSSPASTRTATEQNAAIRAQAMKAARQSTKEYKASCCALFETWAGKSELQTVDTFLALETDLINYLRHLFSLAPELEESKLNLGDILSCGVHFLWSCRKDAGTEGVQLQGTDFEGLDVRYFEHLQSFFSLVSKDLDFANLSTRKIKVGTVVDFQNSEFSKTITDTLSVLQQVYDRILDNAFEDW